MGKWYESEKIIRERRQRSIAQHILQCSKPENIAMRNKDVEAFDKICSYAVSGGSK